MEELQKLYNVLSRDGLYTKSFEEFQQQYSDPAYAEKVFGVVSREGYFTGDKDAFLSKYPISGGGQPTVTETVTETVVEEPKKKGFIQETIDEAIATASASTSEEQPSSSESQETDDLTAFEQSISDTPLESLERYRGDLERSTNLNDVGLAKLEIVNNEWIGRERLQCRPLLSLSPRTWLSCLLGL